MGQKLIDLFKGDITGGSAEDSGGGSSKSSGGKKSYSKPTQRVAASKYKVRKSPKGRVTKGKSYRKKAGQPISSPPSNVPAKKPKKP